MQYCKCLLLILMCPLIIYGKHLFDYFFLSFKCFIYVFYMIDLTSHCMKISNERGAISKVSLV
jgi:hypothetical protein